MFILIFLGIIEPILVSWNIELFCLSHREGWAGCGSGAYVALQTTVTFIDIV